MSKLAYRIVIEPLSIEEGGGYFATVPDLPGCMSDGETPQEALENVQDAILSWIAAAKEMGREVPAPTRTLAVAE
jgi:antitoxin HicB